MKKYIISAFCFLVTMLLSIVTIAQPGGGGDPGCDPADPTCVPFDNGILLLIGFAVLIALKKAYDYKKNLAI